jgi:hypothetical protein
MNNLVVDLSELAEAALPLPSAPLLSLAQSCSSVTLFVDMLERPVERLGSTGLAIVGFGWRGLEMEDHPAVHLEVGEEERPLLMEERPLVDPAVLALAKSPR